MMLRKICCFLLVFVMLLPSYNIFAEDIIGEEYLGKIGESETININGSESENEISIPTDEESILYPEKDLMYSEPYTAITNDVSSKEFNTETQGNISLLSLPFTDSIKEGVRSFQSYINDNLPITYLGTALRTTGTVTSETKVAAVKLIQYKLNLDYNAGLTVDGAFGPASQAAFTQYIGYIERYDTGFWVYILQGLLYCNFYDPGGFDGSYGVGGGTGCLNAVVTFKNRNLTLEGDDGDIGVKTMICLTWKGYTRSFDDGVYYLQSACGTYLHVENGGVRTGTNVYAFSKYTSGTAETTQLRQMWKIIYLGDGLFSIYPMHKPDMALTPNGTNVVVKYYHDLDNFKWEITETSLGFLISPYVYQDQGLSLCVEDNSTDIGANVCVAENSTSYKYWSLTQIENPPEGVIVYDTSTESIVTSPTRWIYKGINTTVSAGIGLAPTFYSSHKASPSFSWTSKNTSVATVNTAGYNLTGIKAGQTTIQGSVVGVEGTHYVNISLTVTPVSDGMYYIRSADTNRYVDIENQTMAAGTQIHQWDLHGGKTQQWRFTLNKRGGYYTIKSVNNASYYLGIENDLGENNTSAVLRNASTYLSAMWYISVSSRGNYILTPQSGTSNNRVLALGTYVVNVDGVDIQQRDYVNDDNLKDEWELVEIGNELTLLNVLEESIDMLPGMRAAVINLKGYSLNYNVKEAMDIDSCLSLIENSKVFIYMGHGSGNIGFGGLAIEPGTFNELMPYHIYNYIGNQPFVDFENVTLTLYAGCKTAYGGVSANTENIVVASVKAGADVAIGFSEDVYEEPLNTWMSIFTENYNGIDSVENACQVATAEAIRKYSTEYNGTNSCCIAFS